MIIGNNTNMQPKSFLRKEQGENSTPVNNMNPMVESNRAMQHTDVMSKNEMNDKAFSMLQDRLNKGLISMDEFNKMCNQLGKRK